MIVYHAVRAISYSIVWAAILITAGIVQPHDWVTDGVIIFGGVVAAIGSYNSLKALRRLGRAQFFTPPTKGSTE